MTSGIHNNHVLHRLPLARRPNGWSPPGGVRASFSVSHVDELQRDLVVAGLQQRNHGLQVISFLAGDT